MSTTTGGAAPRVIDQPKTTARRRRGVLRPILMIGGILVVAVGSGAYWLTGGRVVSIDDAYVQAGRVMVSTDVSGTVATVDVHDNQVVAKGQLLFTLDDRQFRIALEGAKAELGQTVLSIDAMKRDYQRMLRDIDARQAQVQADQASYDRFAGLIRSGGVTRAEYDDARFKLASEQQSVESLKAQAQVQLAKLSGSVDIAPEAMPQYRLARSRVDEAQRQLDHAVVHAPFDGIVSQASTLQPGQYLSAATAAFGLISTDDVWIEANPKETELTWVKDGNPAKVWVDTYPGQVWEGTVESIAPNSGAEFSILPAQNASGNWVKVVQRIMLRVRVPQKAGDPALRAGMSVEVEIDTGHVRKLSDIW